MTVENDFLPFADGGGANVISQSDYAALPALATGFESGTAYSDQVNKVWRQSSVMAYVLAQFIANQSGQPVLDNGNPATILANLELAVQSFGWVPLTSALTLYVSTTGSDSNNGLSPSSPFLTLQGAWNNLCTNYNLNGHQVTISLADGTYTSGLSASAPPISTVPSPPVIILGDTATPTNVIITTSGNCIQTFNGAYVKLSGLTLESSAQAGIEALEGSQVQIGISMVFGACHVAHMFANGGTIIALNTTYAITGGGQCHVIGSAGGFAQITGANITITGTPAFSVAFAQAFQCGNVDSSGLSVSGAATGPRYDVYLNGTINTNGGGANYLPGNSAGMSASGGQYA